MTNELESGGCIVQFAHGESTHWWFVLQGSMNKTLMRKFKLIRTPAVSWSEHFRLAWKNTQSNLFNETVESLCWSLQLKSINSRKSRVFLCDCLVYRDKVENRNIHLENHVGRDAWLFNLLDFHDYLLIFQAPNCCQDLCICSWVDWKSDHQMPLEQ